MTAPHQTRVPPAQAPTRCRRPRRRIRCRSRRTRTRGRSSWSPSNAPRPSRRTTRRSARSTARCSPAPRSAPAARAPIPQPSCPRSPRRASRCPSSSCTRRPRAGCGGRSSTRPRRRPKGRRLRYAVGELLTCTRCTGAWSALGLVALRLHSPAAGRTVSDRARRQRRERHAAGLFTYLCAHATAEQKAAERPAPPASMQRAA